MLKSTDTRIKFVHLAAQVIDCLALPCPPMPASEGDALEIALRIDGARVVLCHEPEINPGHFLVDARIGSIDSQPGAAQHVLVENAALHEYGWLTLGNPPGTDELSYQALLEIAAARADGVADCVRALSRRAMGRSHSFHDTRLRPAVKRSRTHWRAAFDAQARAVCRHLGIEHDEESDGAAGSRDVTVIVDHHVVVLTHRSPSDSFFTARGVSDALSEDVQENVARRLLRANAEFAHEGFMAFGLTPDFRHVVWRVTCRLPGGDVEELISRIRWAAGLAMWSDADRPPAFSLAHMLA